MAQVIGDPDSRLLIVDNTNTRLWECAPYVLAGEAFGHDVKLVSFRAASFDTVGRWAARNTHGVPVDKVCDMYERFEKALPHWNEETVIPPLPQ